MTRAMSLVTHISVSLHFHPGLLYKDISVSSFYYFHPIRPNHPGVLYSIYTYIRLILLLFLSNPSQSSWSSIYRYIRLILLLFSSSPSQSSWSTIYRYIRLILEYHIQIYPPHPGVPYTDISASSSNPSQSSITSRGWIFCLKLNFRSGNLKI